MTGVYERVPQPDAVRAAVAQRLRHGLARSGSMQDAGLDIEATATLRRTVWDAIEALDPIHHGHTATTTTRPTDTETRTR